MERAPFIKRPTILVADIDRSLTVYRDILGFTIHYLKDSDEDSYSYPVFKIPKEAKIRFATLDGPDQVRGLGLTEVKGVELPKPQAPLMSCMVIKVDKIEEVCDKISSLGLETTEIFTDSSHDHTFKEQSFIDFDGHLVVLYEIIS